MKEKNRSLIHIQNCQVKSLEKAKRLCSLLDEMEKEFGIREVRISFKNIFICPDIDLNILSTSDEPMEKLIGELFIKMDVMRLGERSSYFKKTE